MESQLRLKQIMLAASLMLSSALQAWPSYDLLKYVPSMPSISRFFTRSASTDTPVLTAEQIEAARTAALTNGQNNNAAISTNNPTINQTEAIVVVEDFDVDSGAGVGFPGVGGNRVQVQKKQEKTEPETETQNTIPTVPLSSTLLSKKVIIPAAVTTGVSAAAVVATQTEAGRSAVAGFAANVWNPAYNAVTNAAASVDYAALGNRGLALVQNNQLSLGAAAATAAVAGAAYKFWPAKSKEVKMVGVMVGVIEYQKKAMDHLKTLQLTTNVFYQEECNKARQSFEELIIAGNVEELCNLSADYCQKLETFTTRDGQIIAKQSFHIRRAAIEKLNFLLNELSAYSVVHIGHCEPMNAYVNCKHVLGLQLRFANLALDISDVLISLRADMTIPAKASPIAVDTNVVDPAAGVGLPGIVQQENIQQQEKTEPETETQNTIPTVPLSSTLLSKK